MDEIDSNDHDSNPFEDSEADAVAPAIAYHHQDSGIRVIEFPPAYSAI
jgi:hypothetical protein